MKEKPAVHRRVHIFSSFLFAKLTQHGLTQEERLTDALKFSQTQVMRYCVKSDAGFFQVSEWHTRAESHQRARARTHTHTQAHWLFPIEENKRLCVRVFIENTFYIKHILYRTHSL
jgi:hypothetical protein